MGRSCGFYNWTVAPNCGTPREFFTEPAMAPATFRGVAAKLSPTPARHKTPSAREVSVFFVFAFDIRAFDIRRPSERVLPRRLLGYRKRSALCERLVTIFVGDFDTQGV